MINIKEIEDILTSPIVFAIDKLLNELENSEDNNEKVFYESLKRSKEIWEKVNVYGIKTIGLIYEDFCNLLEEKKNIIFFTDNELRKFNKALKIMKAMEE